METEDERAARQAAIERFQKRGGRVKQGRTMMAKGALLRRPGESHAGFMERWYDTYEANVAPLKKP